MFFFFTAVTVRSLCELVTVSPTERHNFRTAIY